MNTDAWGVDIAYQDAAGVVKHVSHGDLVVLRAAIGLPPTSGSWFEERGRSCDEGESSPLPTSGELTLEDGTLLELQTRLPEDLPIGYHGSN
ncbi:MAG: hypothetical protein ABIU05_17075 [Nitrospirales bacterium]